MQGSAKEQGTAITADRELVLPCSPNMLIILIFGLHSTSYQLRQTHLPIACFDFII